MGSIDGWQPIEKAPKDGRVLYFGWFNSDGEECVRADWWDEDSGWYEHFCHYDHYIMVGGPALGPGPTEEAPYKFWLELPELPK